LVQAVKGGSPRSVINDPVIDDLVIDNPVISVISGTTSTLVGESPLHIATKNKLLRNMTLLLDAGADVNIRQTATGATPLHYAAKDHWKEGISLLLKRGGDKEIASFRGRSPRDIWSLTGGPRVVELEGLTAPSLPRHFRSIFKEKLQSSH
jgi:Ankyrin repeats (3 copies)